ncbi:MAG TPA: PIG-L family deacetylase [Terriglobales bacterium]|nr:PIG-L family deacetylase [Terriglobales bacterium]
MAKHSRGFAAWTLLFVLLLVCPSTAPHLAASPAPARGTSELEQLLIQLHTTARLMHTVAHPDDEDGGMLVLEARGEGVTTLQLTLTRGEGGQNRTGSNLFDELGVLRTLELLAADQYYGVEQRFTRVADFGYSKSPDETFDKWHGHDVALADMVRVIRAFRPDVIVSRFQGTARDGHGHHQADGILTREAFRAAADPSRFSEQISEGLEPWQAKKLYIRGTGDYTLALDSGTQSPVLGMSFVQFAMQGLRHQLSQGAGEWQLSARPHVSYYKLVDSVLPMPAEGAREHDFFDGIDTTLPGLADRIGEEESKVPFLRPELAAIKERVDEATHLIPGPSSRLAGPLLAGEEQVAELIDQIDHSELSPVAKSELLVNLRTKRQQFRHAAELALNLELRISTTPPGNGMLVPGQTVRLLAELRNSGDEAVQVQQIALDLPQGWSAPPVWIRPARLKPGDSTTVAFNLTVSPNAELTRPYWHRNDPETDTVYEIDDPRYATLPFPPPPVEAHAVYGFGGRRGTVRAIARASLAENSPPLAVVPAFSLLIAPRTQVVPADSTSPTMVTVDVRGYVAGEASVHLRAPQGWTVTPASAPVRFERSGQERKVSFKLTPPGGAYRPGKLRVRAVLEAAGRQYSEGFTMVTGEDLGTFYYYQPAVQQLAEVEVKVPSGLKIGYIMGAGDEIPTVLRELGLSVEMISPEQVARGDLQRFDTIILGIRAYDTRADLRQNNRRLLDYVDRGGTLVVQYNTNPEEFNAGHYTPYPAQLSHDRVSVEEAPVTLLEPYDRLFRFPNAITAKDFDGWVQERGLYFMDKWDNHYRPLLSCADPGELARDGGLLRARYGRGTYIYTGYAFFRQLPSGVPGAIRLYVNLLSAGHGKP